MWRCSKVLARIKIRIYQMRKVLQTIQAPYYTVTQIQQQYFTILIPIFWMPKKDRQSEPDIQSNQMSQYSLSIMEKNLLVLSKKVPSQNPLTVSRTLIQQDPDGEVEISGKSIFEIQIPNFCYKKCEKLFLYFSQFFHSSVLSQSQSLPLVDS